MDDDEEPIDYDDLTEWWDNNGQPDLTPDEVIEQYEDDQDDG